VVHKIFLMPTTYIICQLEGKCDNNAKNNMWYKTKKLNKFIHETKLLGSNIHIHFSQKDTDIPRSSSGLSPLS
jgi:hypothetical protein